MKPIEMITIHDEEGNVRPYRFRMNIDDELITVQIQRIVERQEQKSLGAHFLIYKCLCIINDRQRELTVRFRKDTCQWTLQK